MSLFEYTRPNKQQQDPLFLERLEAFMERSLVELQTFAAREQMPLDEARLFAAEWHSRYLFQPAGNTESTARGNASDAERQSHVHNTLSNVSRILEVLHSMSGVDSFVLAVDPHDANMHGFLGGSILGREFWRGLRGGGDAGAKAFKNASQKALAPSGSNNQRANAQSIKSELYEKMRTALRTASGNRVAEMKWTHPDKLAEAYGVSLVGWPSSVPYNNPSVLKTNQRRELVQLLDSGGLRFEKAFSTLVDEEPQAGPSEHHQTDDLSWALQFDDAGAPAGGSSPGDTSLRMRWRSASASDVDAGPRKRSKVVENTDT
ncbi:hypothetical protein CYLTODRAFT_418726 [Cylindrobasidium torrendii FP15055 ss-10]|uniref:Uncharacterized protein n=1 Tax=Cylindrobasidium torrendii FP15055 ss-10 TaxID=1314674 RepID=A0A0D7BLQ3_9AGAR|nr:hypothetical protein CYLTODRAFT_418726 [Cylindrobasidium torrendii FP15055 ss-10]